MPHGNHSEVRCIVLRKLRQRQDHNAACLAESFYGSGQPSFLVCERGLQRDHEGYTDEVAYDYFCEELENILYFRFGLRDTISEVGVTDSLEKEMLRSAVTAVSHIVYLNRCFRVISDNRGMED